MNKLKVLRLRLGYSQSNVAKLAGLSTRTYLRVENGQHTPRISTKRKIAQALGAEIQQLWPITENEKAAV